MIKQFIKKLKGDILFKEETQVGDSVLVFIEGNKMSPNTIKQGLVTDITNDVKPGWYIVTIIFVFPPTRVRWQLRYEYFTGKDIFMMSGVPMWIAAIEDLITPEPEPEDEKPEHRPFKLLKGGKGARKSKVEDG